MRPSEALSADWGLYYNGTYMKRGDDVGFVQVMNGRLYFSSILRRNVLEEQVRADSLEVWLPDPQAVNVGGKMGQAYYLGRKAMRSMRKSAEIGDIYYVSGQSYFSAASKIMKEIARGPKYYSLEEALKFLVDEQETARAAKAGTKEPTNSEPPTLNTLSTIQTSIFMTLDDGGNSFKSVAISPQIIIQEQKDSPPKVKYTTRVVAEFDDYGRARLLNSTKKVTEFIANQLEKEGIECRT